jgi:NAD-dependent DNA ligase
MKTELKAKYLHPLLKNQTLSQSIGASIVVLLCVVAIGALQIPQLNKLKDKAKTASLENLKTDVESERLRLHLLQKLPSFGFDNLVADWTFINFLQYFGDDPARAKTGYSLSPEYFEIILARDPYFLTAYLFLSGSTTLYAGMPERSVALMEQGLKSLSPQVPPKSYYVWRYKGTDELLFIGNTQAAKQSFEKAAQWASVYSDTESKKVTTLSAQTAQFLASNPKSKSAQISAWTIVLTNAFDQPTRQIAISRIQALGGKVSITSQGQVKVQLPQKD